MNTANREVVVNIADVAGIEHRYNAEGEFAVNSEGTGAQEFPSITALEGGGFVAAWSTFVETQDGNSGAVKARLFDGNGAKLGPEPLVNTTTQGAQVVPNVVAFPDGRFIVSWMSLEDGDWDVMAQIFDPNGGKIGAEFTVSQFTKPLRNAVAVLNVFAGEHSGHARLQSELRSSPSAEDNTLRHALFRDFLLPFAAKRTAQQAA